MPTPLRITVWRLAGWAMLLALLPGSQPAAAGAAPAAASAGNRVTFRDDQTFLVNGKPFFPVGLYYVFSEIADPTGQQLAELRDLGFNYIFYHGQPKFDELDRIAKAGLLVHYRPPGALHSQLDGLEEFVRQTKSHPAILLWEMDDEPVLNKTSFEDSKRGCELMKRLDPDHPILVNQSPGPTELNHDELVKWASICHINGFDFYPIPMSRPESWGVCLVARWSQSIAAMGDIVRDFQRAVPGKPVLPVLQAFSFDPVKYGHAGYPTPEQSRFMAYHVVIRGAKGISYYGQIRVSAPNSAVSVPPKISRDPVQAAAAFAKACELNDWFWAQFKPVLKEIGSMTPVFAAREVAWELPKGREPVQTISGWDRKMEYSLRLVGNTKVILLVNPSRRPVRIEVTLPAFAGATVHCWHERRTLPADAQGVFADDVEPFGVRVYSSAPADVVLANP